MKEVPVYVLTATKGGVKSTPAKPDENRILNIGGDPSGKTLDRVVVGRKLTMADLAELLQLPGVTDRIILNRTDLADEFDFDVK